MDRLKNLFLISSEYSLPSTIITPLEIAKLENQTHIQYLNDITPKTWLQREPLDTKLESILRDSLKKTFYIQFYGTPGCGKSALLCRLYQLLNKQEHPKNLIVVRFCGLTDSSIFANEIFRNLFLQVIYLFKN